MELPEVRQCIDEESRYYGCTATKSLVPFGKWFIGNPGPNINAAGGHWEDNEEVVKDWKVLGV